MSKRDAKVCVRIAGPGRRAASSTTTTWTAMTNQILALQDHLVAASHPGCSRGDWGLLEAVLLPT